MVLNLSWKNEGEPDNFWRQNGDLWCNMETLHPIYEKTVSVWFLSLQLHWLFSNYCSLDLKTSFWFDCHLVNWWNIYALQLWITRRKMNLKMRSKMNLLNRWMIYSVAFPPWSNPSFRWNSKFFLPSLWHPIFICSMNTWWMEM